MECQGHLILHLEFAKMNLAGTGKAVMQRAFMCIHTHTHVSAHSHMHTDKCTYAHTFKSTHSIPQSIDAF